MHYPLNSFDYKSSDTIPFIDYGDSGIWILGLMRPNVLHKNELFGVIDEDTCIESLITRAIGEWQIDATELWISDCGGQLAVWQRNGMQV